MKTPEHILAKPTAASEESEPILDNLTHKVEQIRDWTKGRLRAYLIIAVTLTGGSWFVGNFYYSGQLQKRSEEVMRFNDFLNGKIDPSEHLDIYGRRLVYDQILQLIYAAFYASYGQEAVNYKTHTDLKNSFDSFAKMILVEDIIGSKIKNLPVFDHLGLSRSYGYGQITPHTALTVLDRNRSHLGKEFPDLMTTLDQIKAAKTVGKPLSSGQLAHKLNLTGSANLLSSLFYFNELNLAYSTVHQETENAQKPDHTASLAVAAYAAKPTSPAVAKVQTALNDLILFDHEQALALGLPTTPLTVDGDLGQATEQALQILQKAGLEISPALESLKSGQAINDQVELLSELANNISQMTNLGPKVMRLALENNAQEVLSACQSRSGATIALYEYLQGRVLQKQSRNLTRLFLNYIKNRDNGFFNLLMSEEEFYKHFPSLTYHNFLRKAAVIFNENLLIDNNYYGVVPTFYEAGSTFHEAKNPLDRVVTFRLLEKVSLKPSERP